MPRKSKLEGARAAKLQKLANSTRSLVGSEEDMPIPAFSDYESEDVTYDPNTDQLDEEQAIHVHAKEWVQCLHRDDVISLTSSSCVMNAYTSFKCVKTYW